MPKTMNIDANAAPATVQARRESTPDALRMVLIEGPTLHPASCPLG